MYALEMGAHAFFVRKDLLHPDDHDLPIRAVLKASHPPDDELKREFLDTRKLHAGAGGSGGSAAERRGDDAFLAGILAQLQSATRDLEAERSRRSEL